MKSDHGSKPHKLQLQYLKDITNNFSRVLGKGGFAVVYEGVQPDGGIVAVKKLLNPMSQKQFENEVDLLMRLEHPNIVRLVGYCYEIKNEHMSYNGKPVFAEEIQSLLCLEYLPNGSLDKFLSDPDKSTQLDWHTRYKIIEGTCNGLRYLHEHTNGPIIHLDLKPGNILLNDVLEPKLADFGLSRGLDGERTVCTMAVSGTLGYMPQEYLQGILTPMSDIYSLGVIILEVVTGERKYPDNIPPLEEFIETELQKWRNMLQKAPQYTSLEIDCLQIRRCIQIGLICLNPSRFKRPTISKIIKMLQGLEGMDCNFSNEATSPADQIRSGPRELLDIHPLELSFTLEPDNRICCLVKLINKTSECVAFHFKVIRAQNNYRIEPAGGFLWPRATSHVVVTMEKRGELLPSDLQCNDEFLVQSIIVREHKVTSKHIPEQTFETMPISVVHKVKLPGSAVSQRNKDALVECLRKGLGYCAGKPVAAVLIYKCCVQWRTFEGKKTTILDCIIQLIGAALEEQHDNETFAYWLNNSFTLLLLMQRTFKPSAAALERQVAVFKARGAHLPSSILGRIILKNNLPQLIEVGYPALHFNQQLTAYLDQTYGMIREGLKKEVSAFLDLCIEAPRSRVNVLAQQALIIDWQSIVNTLTNYFSVLHSCYAPRAARQAMLRHWQSIVKILANYLSVLKSSYIPSFIICKLFSQIFSYINAKLFNSLLLRAECCSFSHGEYVKAGLAELHQWSIDATEEYAGGSWEELKHIRQAVKFLVTLQKPAKTLKDITNDLCPVLSLQQLYRISSRYQNDNGTETVSSEVLSSMEIMIAEGSNNGVDVPFVLGDDLSIPSWADDIQRCAPEFEVADVDMPPLVREYPCFNFLHETNDKLACPDLQS